MVTCGLRSKTSANSEDVYAEKQRSFSNGLHDELWDTECTLDYVLEELEAASSRMFTSTQVPESF